MRILKRLLALAAALLVFVSAYGLWVLAPMIGESWTSIETDEKVVALTFDDGPYPPFTDQILDLLARKRVPATFFVSGAYAEQHPHLVRRALADGHQVGNHSWNADVLAWMGPAEAWSHIDRTDAVLRALGVPEPIEFRAPRTLVGPFAAWHLSTSGRRRILGSAAGRDWLHPGQKSGECAGIGALIEALCPTQVPLEIVATLNATVAPGGILTLHDGFDAAPGADRSGTVEAAGILIDQLLADGYRFLTVEALLRRAN